MKGICLFYLWINQMHFCLCQREVTVNTIDMELKIVFHGRRCSYRKVWTDIYKLSETAVFCSFIHILAKAIIFQNGKITFSILKYNYSHGKIWKNAYFKAHLYRYSMIMVVISYEREIEDSTPSQQPQSGAAHFSWWTIVSCAKEAKIFNNSR